MDNYSSDEDIDFAIYQRRHRQIDRSQQKVSFYREVAKRANLNFHFKAQILQRKVFYRKGPNNLD